MKIKQRTIKALQELINGDIEYAFYRGGRQLVDLFNEFGQDDRYGEGFPARKTYTTDCINNFNGTDALRKVIEAAFDPRDYITPTKVNQWVTDPEPSKLSLEKTIIHLNEFLAFDGYALKQEDGKSTYKVFQTDGAVIPEETLGTLSHEFINQQIQKSRDKLTQGDYDGAITNARSLVESFQEELIKKAGEEVPDYAGDISKLYKTTKKVMKFDSSQKDLSDTLKQVLSGLNSIMMGIAGLSNKMGDRHARTYKPERHHAKLAVNSALMFCEFLLDSYEYQQGKKTP